MKVLSIIVPLYNEAKTVSYVIQQLIDLETVGWDKEIIVVDDGSKDASGQILKKFVSRIVYIRHPFNQGKGAAIRTGLLKARGQAILVQDADFEYSPADIPALLKIFSDSVAVYGSRNLSPRRQGYLPYIF